MPFGLCLDGDGRRSVPNYQQASQTPKFDPAPMLSLVTSLRVTPDAPRCSYQLYRCVEGAAGKRPTARASIYCRMPEPIDVRDMANVHANLP